MAKLIIGCGYLGKRVAETWKQQGHRVFVTTRHQTRAEKLQSEGFEPLVCDVTAPKTLADLPAVSTVLYAVGMDRTAGHSMWDVYVQGLANVLEKLPRPERFLYVSSTSVYGQFTGEVVDEDTTPRANEGSGKIVLEAETTLLQSNPDAVILRFAGIYGPGRVMRRQTIEAGEPVVGNPEDLVNLIHVQDGVRAVLQADIYARPGRVYNICDGHAVTRKELYTHLGDVLSAPTPTFVPPSAEKPAPRHAGNRQVSNKRLLEELQFTLEYCTYRTGMPASLENS
ncbi:MAG: SDR family oxidoreductase [Gemmataceae bacterium]